MVNLNNISFAEGGRRIIYDYHYDAALSKYFNKSEPFFVEYTVDVSQVPLSIAVIPFLANVMPMAWFVGFDVSVADVDQTFNHSLLELKAEFSKHFPDIKQSSLHAEAITQNEFREDNAALLFSGGLDSFESLTRNLKLNPYLISVLGADIEISDTKHWDDFVRFNKEEAIVNDARIYYVTSNLRTFYTYEMDLLANLSWWGTIQHGMALLSLIAPLGYLFGIRKIFIASSNTGEVNFGWGSTSETDEKVKWANSTVIHDGFHLRRTDKIQNIVDFAKNTGNCIKLRVCYHNLREGYNCSRCAKCQRTMLGLILCGENPNKYGFNVPDDFYSLIFKNFTKNATMTTGVAYEWRCLQEKARESQNPFVFGDHNHDNIATFAALQLDRIINQNDKSRNLLSRAKHIVILKFPKLFKFYLRIRRKF